MDSMYITKEAIIKREGNTLYLIRAGEKRSVPVHRLREINCIAPVTFRSGAIKIILKSGILVHFFNSYGFYEGTLYPRDKLISGEVLVNQAAHYLSWKKRRYIAVEMVNGIKHNILRNLKKSDKNLGEIINEIEEIKIRDESIEHVLNSEAQIWQKYYRSLDATIRGFKLERRGYHPPINELNALISFGNSLLYTAALSEIYHTQLNPSVSYLHEPSERRFSLSLDFADVFKPTIVYRHIHDLVNHGIITEDDFRKEMNGVFLNDKGKKKFIAKWEDRMKSTVYHRHLKKSVSQRHLLRLEAYKLVKHVMNDGKYRAFKAWW